MDKGETIFEVYRNRKHKYRQLSVFLGLILFFIIVLYYVRLDPFGAFLSLFCLILFWFYTIQLVLRNTKTSVLTIYENGIHSELLAHSGAYFIPWKDIDNVVLDSTEAKGKWLNVLRLVIASDLHYNRKLPLRTQLFSLEKGFVGDALSIPVTYILDVGPLVLLKTSKTALEEYRAKHGA